MLFCGLTFLVSLMHRTSSPCYDVLNYGQEGVVFTPMYDLLHFVLSANSSRQFIVSKVLLVSSLPCFLCSYLVSLEESIWQYLQLMFVRDTLMLVSVLSYAFSLRHFQNGPGLSR